MKLSDIRGEVAVDPQAAKAWAVRWFREDDLITIVGRRSEAADKYNTLSMSMTAREFVEQLDDPDFLRGLVFDTEDGSCWNLYAGVCPVKEPARPTQRGTEDNVLYVPGVWADIDVKPGGFESTEDIIEFLSGLPLYPSMICGSGSGGIHAYWRMHWDRAADKQLVEEWWSFLDEQAGGRSIDKLIDVTRILRVPGTVNFPKQSGSGDAKLRPVVLHQATGQTYSPEEVREIAADAYARRREMRRSMRSEDQQRRYDADAIVRKILQAAEDGDVSRWRMFRAIAYVEDIVNLTYTWDDILTQHGWTYLRELRDGSKEWARPGRKERSAVCDFEDSPVMSLLSTSEDTGLSDLLDARIPLTRYRVLLRLHYNDDHNALLQDILRDQGII